MKILYFCYKSNCPTPNPSRGLRYTGDGPGCRYPSVTEPKHGPQDLPVFISMGLVSVTWHLEGQTADISLGDPVPEAPVTQAGSAEPGAWG